MKASVRLFGQFRNRALEPRLDIELASEASARDAKTALCLALYGPEPSADELALIDDSAIASATEVLTPDAALAAHANSRGQLELAILPPVCGG